ncbi:MAG: laccase domain-containing protein [bacterium]|nr:laccase domain-containing protein [bacterium]MDZ4284578.1 laccase domain-containing protein [Patescibacteria group bacterium]
MNPSAIFTPFDGKVEVRLFGRNGADVDWRIDAVRRQEELEHAEALEQFSQLRHVALQAGIDTVYAPDHSRFNAAICESEDFTERISLANSKFALLRGPLAEGCVLPPHSGAWFSVADCHVIVAYNTATHWVIAAHAGRDSLFNRAAIVGDIEPTVRSASVVDAIINGIRRGISAEIKVFVAGGIGPVHFTHDPRHPRYAVANKAILAHFYATCGHLASGGYPASGCLSIPEIIRAQFQHRDIEPSNIATDGTDTYSALDADNDYVWWSHRRAVSLGQHDGRNGVLVIRRR